MAKLSLSLFMFLAFSASADTFVRQTQFPGMWIAAPPPAPQPIQGLNGQPQMPPPMAPQDQTQADQGQQLMNMLNQMTGTNRKNGYFSDGGADLRDGYSSRYGWKQQIATDGKMESCTMPPPRVLAAFDESMKFRERCEPAQRGEGQRIVVNDFSSTDRQAIPYMYIFSQDGKCLGKTAVTYGNGLGDVVPEPCSANGCHLTPPGFHLTAFHDSDSYPAGTSLAMVGLEGQGSVSRGVLIHPAARPGTASSFGCAGVGSFDTVKKTLGEGALVYNFFGDKTAASGCRKPDAGFDHSRPCHLETSQRAIPASATGEGTPAMK